MTAVVLRGDARALPLPDASVDLVVTSPPYFGLRSYTDGGAHFESQIGSEATPAEWLAAMVECVAEMARVLKPSGSIFLNVGDKYGGADLGGGYSGKSTLAGFTRTGSGRPAPGGGYQNTKGRAMDSTRPRGHPMGQPKSLLGLPWRLALACTDQLGLILRRDIIWSKPNGLPESVTDRCRSSHEYVFHLVKQPRYYAAVDEIREAYAPETAARYAAGYNSRAIDSQRIGIGTKLGGDTYGENPLGKLPGSVWSIPSQPLTVPAHLGADHFAAFPMELPRRCILGWSPPGICTACGEGRRPVAHQVDKAYAAARARVTRTTEADFQRHPGRSSGVTASAISNGVVRPDYRITGYACACPDITAPTQPSLIVDPFCGTGTTMLTASVLGRIGIGIDRSADYCRLATWRCSDPGERAKAMQVPKPPPVPAGQVSLFDLDAS